VIAAIPLTIVPLIIFNLVAVLGPGDSAFASGAFALTLVSGARWSVSAGDLLVALAIVMLFLEVMKAARASPATIGNHIVSTLVLIVYVIEFVVVGAAATSTFFFLTLFSLFDVVAGFSISIRTATRDVSFGRGDS
jgi:hypothetical protein